MGACKIRPELQPLLAGAKNLSDLNKRLREMLEQGGKFTGAPLTSNRARSLDYFLNGLSVRDFDIDLADRSRCLSERLSRWGAGKKLVGKWRETNALITQFAEGEGRISDDEIKQYVLDQKECGVGEETEEIRHCLEKNTRVIANDIALLLENTLFLTVADPGHWDILPSAAFQRATKPTEVAAIEPPPTGGVSDAATATPPGDKNETPPPVVANNSWFAHPVPLVVGGLLAAVGVGTFVVVRRARQTRQLAMDIDADSLPKDPTPPAVMPPAVTPPGPAPAAIPPSGITPPGPALPVQSAGLQMPTVGEIFLDRYRIDREMGGGGMSRLFLATETDLHTKNEQVVIKLLEMPEESPNAPPDVIKQLRERFKREAAALIMLNHPHIVGAKTFETMSYGQIALVQEYVRGKSLHEILEVEGALPPQHVGQIAAQILQALIYIHRHKIYHRDLKPGNIMLVPKEGGDYHVKIIDFGIVEMPYRPNLTAPGMACGTPSYASPEQLRGEQIDGRSDLYSLGVVMYEMLKGEPPFTGNTPTVIADHIHLPPPPLPDGPLSALVMHALTKDPSGRPQTAEQFLDKLQPIVREIADSAAASEPTEPLLERGAAGTRTDFLGLSAAYDVSAEGLKQLAPYAGRTATGVARGARVVMGKAVAVTPPVAIGGAVFTVGEVGSSLLMAAATGDAAHLQHLHPADIAMDYGAITAGAEFVGRPAANALIAGLHLSHPLVQTALKRSLPLFVVIEALKFRRTGELDLDAASLARAIRPVGVASATTSGLVTMGKELSRSATWLRRGAEVLRLVRTGAIAAAPETGGATLLGAAALAILDFTIIKTLDNFETTLDQDFDRQDLHGRIASTIYLHNQLLAKLQRGEDVKFETLKTCQLRLAGLARELELRHEQQRPSATPEEIGALEGEERFVLRPPTILHKTVAEPLDILTGKRDPATAYVRQVVHDPYLSASMGQEEYVALVVRRLADDPYVMSLQLRDYIDASNRILLNLLPPQEPSADTQPPITRAG